MKDSILNQTKSEIKASLQKVNDVSLEFVRNDILERPPFQFFQALLHIYVHRLAFACGLYDERELDTRVSFCRQEKLRILFKALASVALITNERVDLLVSPAKVLAGQDVQSAHYFLQCLVKASSYPPNVTAGVASKIRQSGVKLLYKRSVKARNFFLRVQRGIRSKRIQVKVDTPVKLSEKGTQCENIRKAKAQLQGNKSSPSVKESPQRQTDIKTLPKRCKKVDSSPVVRRRSTKLTIVNGVKIRTTIEEPEDGVESNHDEAVEEENEVLNTKLKKDLEKVQEREIRLKRRIEDMKAKEEHLTMHEERINRVATFLRKKEERMKQENMKKDMEAEKMRLEIYEVTKQLHSPKDRNKVKVGFSQDSNPYEDLLERARDNPTITDLRLLLERKLRAVAKKNRKLIEMERSLLHQQAMIAANVTNDHDEAKPNPQKISSTIAKTETSDASSKADESSPSVKKVSFEDRVEVILSSHSNSVGKEVEQKSPVKRSSNTSNGQDHFKPNKVGKDMSQKKHVSKKRVIPTVIHSDTDFKPRRLAVYEKRYSGTRMNNE